MANDTHADAREELQVRASWFSLLGPFHTPASTSFLEEERTHGKSWSLSAESASQLRPWSQERVPQLHVCQWTLSWFHRRGNRSDRNACRGKTRMAALEWGRTSPARGSPQYSVWLMHPGQKLPLVSLTQEGEEGPWGAGVNPPPPHCPDEVICCFFSRTDSQHLTHLGVSLKF